MRLLFVTDLAYPDHLGGSHRVVYEVARRLAGRGHEVHVITGQPADRPAPAEELLCGMVYHRIRRRRFHPLAQALSYAGGALLLARRLVQTRPFDAVSAHYPLTTLGALHVLRSAGTRVVVTFHGPWAEEYRVELGSARRPEARLLHAAARQIERHVLGRADRIHALSRFMADQAHELYRVPKARITVVPGGVDLEAFTPAADRQAVRRALGLPLDRPLLFTVRRLYARMGLESLVTAMVRVIAAKPEALLIIGGTGPLRADLEAQISRSDLTDHVRLLGRVSEEDLPRLYQAADLFVLPTAALEGFGLVTLEALACGTPVVGTPVGATPEILGPLDPRLLCASAGPDDLAETLLEVMIRPPVTRRECRAHVEQRFSWDRLADALERLFRGPEGGS